MKYISLFSQYDHFFKNNEMSIGNNKDTFVKNVIEDFDIIDAVVIVIDHINNVDDMDDVDEGDNTYQSSI